MRKNLHEIRNIQEAMYKLQDAVDKFDGCVASDVRHSTDKDIADEMYHIAKELNVCIVSLATKRDEEHQERGPQSTSIDSWLEEYFCDYCGDKNDKSSPLVENIKGQLVCECCIDGEEQL
jgi:hypothetical protein